MKRNTRLKMEVLGYLPTNAPKHLSGMPVLTHVDKGRVYQLNGKRECARRRRQREAIEARRSTEATPQ